MKFRIIPHDHHHSNCISCTINITKVINIIGNISGSMVFMTIRIIKNIIMILLLFQGIK